MSFGFEQIKSDSIKRVATAAVVVETTVSDSESGGINRVLSALADGKLMTLEQTGESVLAGGRVNFKLVYLDGEDEIRGLDYFADFSEKIEIANVHGKLFGKINVIDAETSLSAGAKLSAALEIAVYAVETGESECLSAADDDFYIESSQISTQALVTSLTSSFEITDEYETRADVSQVLLLDTGAYITDVNFGMGNVLVSGAVTASITYHVNDDIKNVQFDIPFSEELSRTELAMGQLAAAEASVKGARVVLTGVEGNNVIKADCEVELKLQVFADKQADIVSDIFSVEKELEVTRENMSSSRFCGNMFFTDKINGVATLEPDMPAVREILSVCAARNTVAQAIAGDGRITIEGVLTANVLYRDENGINSAEAEIPYSLAYTVEGMTEDYELYATGAVCSASARAKRDREIEIFADVCFKVEKYLECETAFISEVVEGADKDMNKSAVSVYIAEEGETIWDAAKALSARPDVLRQQNPELSSPFKAGDKVVYYRQIIFEF